MSFFLKFDGNKYVPIGKYLNVEEAVRELHNSLYEKIIRARKRKRKNLFIIRRDMPESPVGRIRLWQAPLRIKETKGSLSVLIKGEFEPEFLY